MKKIVVAQIGVGYWGPNIFRNLLKNKKCHLKIVVDKKLKRLAYVKKITKKVKTSTNINSILNDSEVNAVIISTPPQTHYDIAIKCLGAGKNILVEKPITTNLIQYKILAKLAAKKNLILMAGDLYLFNSAILYIKKLIKNDYLGRILYFNSERKNLGRVRSDVDVNWSLSTHDISIIQFLMNYQKPINCKKNDYKFLQKKISDVSHINMDYKNNVSASISVSWLNPEKIRKLIIVGSKKMLIYDDLKSDEIQIINKSVIPYHGKKNSKLDYDRKFSQFKYQIKKTRIIKIKKTEPLKNEIHHFFQCIIKKNFKCKTDYKHSISLLQIMERINKKN